jgi:hypothetical protein
MKTRTKKQRAKINARAYSAIDPGRAEVTEAMMRRACGAQVRRDNYDRKHPIGWTR